MVAASSKVVTLTSGVEPSSLVVVLLKSVSTVSTAFVFVYTMLCGAIDDDSNAVELVISPIVFEAALNIADVENKLADDDAFKATVVRGFRENVLVDKLVCIVVSMLAVDVVVVTMLTVVFVAADVLLAIEKELVIDDVLVPKLLLGLAENNIEEVVAVVLGRVVASVPVDVAATVADEDSIATGVLVLARELGVDAVLVPAVVVEIAEDMVGVMVVNVVLVTAVVSVLTA